MRRALRRRLSYANVMATVAVFIALGGSSYAALTITGADVRNGSLSYRDLKKNTLGGSRVKESRLGKVPRARNADRLNGLSAARLLVRCPDATVPVYDVCVETSARGPAAVYGSGGCMRRGRPRRDAGATSAEPRRAPDRDRGARRHAWRPEESSPGTSIPLPTDGWTSCT